MDRKKIDKFWLNRTKIKDPRISTHFRYDDTHLYDLKLINKFINRSTKILDLACGTCYISNELVDQVKYIKAVDKFPQFLNHCKKSANLETVACDVLEFQDNKKYDLILLIGIMLFFEETEREMIYKKCHDLLTPSGVLFIRHQCGLNEDVTIDKYSESIGSRYLAKYLYLEKEKKILENFFKVQIIDIFPKRLNTWKNTHHYAFICKKK